MMRKIWKEIFLWGIFLWFVGYLLGIIFFTFIPVHLIGWVIMPIGITLLFYITSKRITYSFLKNYLLLAAGWALLAIVLDYFLLVQLFRPEDGYYKMDVYLYYLITFFLPLLVGWIKTK